MKKHGILNSHISKVLADLGHTDQITIGDCGLPIPEHTEKIDLALKLGEPPFLSVLETVLAEMEVEKVILASEIKSENIDLYNKLSDKFSKHGILIMFISHDEFKQMTHHSKAIIRTGEATPYANIILQSGVIF